MHLYPKLVARSLYAFAEALVVWNHHVQVLSEFVVLFSLVSVLLVVAGVLTSQLNSVQGPSGVLAFFNAWKRCCSSFSNIS